MAFKTQGEILEILELKKVGKNNFPIQEFVLEIDQESDYPQTVMFQLIGDKSSALENENLKAGDQVKIAFNLRGKPWEKNGKKMYFNSLNVFEMMAVKSLNGQKHEPQADFIDDKLEELPF